MITGLISAGLGLASSLFGKSSGDSQEQSVNKGFDFLQGNQNVQQAQTIGAGAAQQQDQAYGLRGAVLGLEGKEAQQRAMGSFQESPNYQYVMDEAMGAVTSSRAAKGLLNSGATGKAMMQEAGHIASAEFNNWMNQLGAQGEARGSQANAGLNAALGVGNAATAAGGAEAGIKEQTSQNVMSGIGGLAKGVASIFGF